MNIYPTDAQTADLNRLGDEIAELTAHLEAAAARLLDLIREFDARGGWGRPGSRCSRTACAFRPERLSAWPAMRPGS